MSRSRKKIGIVKDSKYNRYWRTIRREWKQKIKNGDYELRQPREIVNDYDYCDYWFFTENLRK